MRLIELLKELNISLETLRKYETYVNFEFNSINLSVPEDVYKKIIQVHNDQVIQQEINKILVYQENDNYRCVASVKWYYNHQTSGEYGFLEIKGLPDVHFSGKTYLHNNPEYLKPGDEVIVTLNKKDVDTKKLNIKAIAVNDLPDEKDVNFLLFYLLNHIQILLSKKIEVLIDQISILSEQLTEDDRQSIQLFINEKINLRNLRVDRLKHIPSLLKACRIDLTYFNSFLSKLNPDQLFEIWKDNVEIEIEFDHIKEMFTNHLKHILITTESKTHPKGAGTNSKIYLINNEIKSLSRISNEQQKEVLDPILDDAITQYEEITFHYLASVLSIYHSINIPVDFEFLPGRLNPKIIFNLWLKVEQLEIAYELIEKEFREYLKRDLHNATKLLVRFEIEQKKEILDQLFLETCLLNEDSKYDFLIAVIGVYNRFNIPVNYINISKEQHLRFWEDNFISEFPFNQVFNKLMTLKRAYFEGKTQTNAFNDEEFVSKKYEEYIDRIKEVDLKNILAKTHYSSEVINEDDQFKTIVFFIENIPQKYKIEYINSVFKKASDYYKLKLFVLHYTDEVDYNEVVIYTGLLSSDNQKLFFKKIIKLIAENKIVLSLDDLNRVTTIDYQTSEYAKEIDGVGLDFTLSVILKVINDLKNNITTSRSSIFDLVANQIKTPKDLLVIDGFFEKCSGKTIIEENGTKKLNDGTSETIYKTTKKEQFLPRFSTFCDGSKAFLKGKSQPALCKKSGLEFWWCENSQCYDVCRKTHTPAQWKNYTLEDVLNILKIPYDPIQYEILLNVINRVNRFLEHLSCRKCNSILKPKGKANYAFYGVTMFSCKNQDCEDHAKDIYLSHCLNGQCEDIIDSRDSVKCKTHGYEDECGWYICKNCNACCSSEKLKARAGYLANFGQEYKCHLEGHRDRGIICCSDCGHEMNEPAASIELFKKQLNWFLEHKDNHPNIFKSGQRKNDGKWWFIWTRGSFSYEDYRNHLQSLFSSGFSIPDFNKKEKDNQLIAEPFGEKKLGVDKVFVCPNCDKHFDLKNTENFDYARKRAIQKFHINIFPLIDI